MSVVKIVRVKTRLAQQVRKGPRIGVAMAVKQAELRVEALRSKILVDIDNCIQRAEALDQELRADTSGWRAMDHCADQLAGLAGGCGLEALAEAALGLCALLDCMQEEGAWDMAAISVHVASLRLLQREGSTDAGRKINAGLRAVRDRYLAVRAERGL